MGLKSLGGMNHGQSLCSIGLNHQGTTSHDKAKNELTLKSMG
ncbi:hypothetical protein SOHN41_01767 [Shewanella sp. HN-41]|nr:hypothetical protein SOHN41_01767 [Shewanella sp. HN-41]